MRCGNCGSNYVFDDSGCCSTDCAEKLEKKIDVFSLACARAAVRLAQGAYAELLNATDDAQSSAREAICEAIDKIEAMVERIERGEK